MKKIIIITVLLNMQLYAKPKIWIENSNSIFNISENIFHVNGKKTFDNDIRDLVKDDPKSLMLAEKAYNEAKWQGRWGIISLLGTLTSASSIFFVSSSPETFGLTLLSGMIVSLTGLLYMFSYSIDRQYYLDKAINTYNGVYETTPKSAGYRFDKELRGDIMLGMARF